VTDPDAPRIVVTTMVASAQGEPEVAARKNDLYAAGIRRHGGRPILLDATVAAADRAEAFSSMDGLLLAGGADIHPSLYGQPDAGSRSVEGDRDALEAEAWVAALARGVPVLGICRGFQAINVFSGGTLLQHVDGHAGPSWGHGPAATHPIRVDRASLLGRALADPATSAGSVAGAGPGADLEAPPAGAHAGGRDDTPVVVNTYHHQAVLATDLAPGLRATAWAESPAGDLVEAFEAADDRFVVGIQCHPERTESTPPAFERLWAAFVDACRGQDGARRPATRSRRPRAARPR
jgi:putative glutamine amidotransferase